MKSREIKTTWRLVTPLFGGGAQPVEGDSALRVPALRGALRFWLRAVLWGRLGNVGEVHKVEEELFGSADKGQGLVLLRLKVLEEENRRRYTVEEAKRQWGVGKGKGYMTYGLLQKEGPRPWVEPGARYELGLLCKPKMTEEQRQWLEMALRAFALFGNVGAKSRKGFGSLALEAAEGLTWQLPQTLAAWQVEMTKLLDEIGVREGLPPYSAFSGRSRLVLAQPATNDAWSVLDHVGKELIRFRSWGRNGEILFGEPAKRLFPCDHNEVLEIGQGQRNPGRMPRRAIFGLPHNYFFSGSKVKVNVNAFDGKDQRRSSPLFFKALPLANGQYVLAALLLAAEFLPSDMKVQFKEPGRNGKEFGSVTADNDYRPIEQFLSRLGGQCWDSAQGWRSNQKVEDEEVRATWQ